MYRLGSLCSSPVTSHQSPLPHSPSTTPAKTLPPEASPVEMKGGDITAPKGAPYPGTAESPELRSALIRKIYVVLCLQFLLTAVVAAVVVKVPAIPHFFLSTHAGHGLYMFILFFPFIVMCLMDLYREKHPVNLLLLGLFTVAISFSVGMIVFPPCMVILEGAILTTVAFLSLTAYTFWAASRGHDFSFLGHFLFTSLIVLLVFGFIQILFQLDKLSLMIFGVLAALIFSGFIVYDTDNIIKRCAGGIHLLWLETRTTSSSVTHDD
ncbi:protein LIFEGUARD 2-like [Triticum dicoccoides]|uniref:protein LIFEGUARD 2-like n=1 Tax=Triticum dicoccoides TaxID=85692 RepID=UPI00188EC3A9|nr:protein LIFEGUARD 2-like [Triticum dicoccoides]